MAPTALQFRTARDTDLPILVGWLAADPLGAKREDASHPLPKSYWAAFRALEADPQHELIVAESGGQPVGFLQLSFLIHLTYRGGTRAQIEGVRVAESHRGQGIGRALLEHSLARARDRGAHLVQLTTDKGRPEAIAFYEGLGFRASHEGMKLHF